MKTHADGQKEKECGGATHGGILHDFWRLRQEKIPALACQAAEWRRPRKPPAAGQVEERLVSVA